MDILNSKVFSIEGRLYVNYFEEATFIDRDSPPVTALRPENTKTTVKRQQEAHAYQHFIDCPSPLFKYVIGTKGQTIKRLREETGARIEIPRRKTVEGITVSANSQQDLDAARTRIELLLSEKRWKEPFGHFLSIPLTNQAVKTGFQTFKQEVLKTCGSDRGITEHLFQNKDKIHLTLTPLTLLDESECKKAIAVLKRIQTSQLFKDIKDTSISVSGIEYMNDDPQMVDVLYAKVCSPKQPGILQDLADYVVQEFEAAGLAKKEYNHVKLHATVMNTIRTMAKSELLTKGGRASQKRETFDARNVLGSFKDYHFGEFPLTAIHISKRHTADKDGYYESLYVTE